MVTVNPQKRRFRHRRRGSISKEKLGAAILGSIVVLYCVAWCLVWSNSSGGGSKSSASSLSSSSTRSGGGGGGGSGKLPSFRHPDLHLQDMQHHENSEFYDSIAADILRTLDCPALHNRTLRILENAELEKQEMAAAKEKEGEEEQEAKKYVIEDDWLEVQGRASDYFDITGQHLFCLAAYPTTADDEDQVWDKWKEKIHCNVVGDTTQQQDVLDLWSTVRAEMSQDVIKHVLHAVTENLVGIQGTDLHVWAASGDRGTEYMASILDQRNLTVDQGGIAGLEHNLGHSKLFVDVGSGLGYTSMAVALLYPGTQIVSIEAASTNWLLQKLNWLCNKDALGDPEDLQVLLAGVGPSTGHSQMAQFHWNPMATTDTSAWLPEANAVEDRFDARAGLIQLSVKLRTWQSILKDAEITSRQIDVLNVDCEGCEYNLIPALTDDEFQSMATVMGGMHWGYIPVDSLPSSERGKATHERLCQHENFAATAIECCAFPDLPVTSSVAGEVLVKDVDVFPPRTSDVKDVAGELCDTFEEWARDHHLHDVQSDWGWFQMTGEKQ